MEFGYVVKIANKNLYKEVQLPKIAEHFRIGMRPECDVRLYRDDFFEQIELDFMYIQGKWRVGCSDNIYFDAGDVRKLLSYDLQHGDTLAIRYQKSNEVVFDMEFLFDFDNEVQQYDCIFDLSGVSGLSIGDDGSCQIQLNSPYVHGDRVLLNRQNDRFMLSQKNSLYGIYVNGKKLTKPSYPLQEHDFFSIANYHFYYKKGQLYTHVDQTMRINGANYVKSKVEGVLKYPKFNRNTRINTVLPTDPIEVLDPPAKPSKPEASLLMSLVPALSMLILTVVLRGFMSSGMGTFVIFSACTMTIGIITSIISYFKNKKKFKKQIEDRDVSYREYIAHKREEVQKFRDKERELLDHIYPDMKKDMELVQKFEGDLFDKTLNDQDFLCVRLGTGKVEAVRKINYKNQEKFVSDDELTYMPEQVAKDFYSLTEAPIILNLKKSNAVGIVGETQDQYDLVRNMILDLAIHHYYEDVGFTFIMNEKQQESFKWVRLLPHVSKDGSSIRRIACDEESRTVLFEDLYKELSKRKSYTGPGQFKQLVIFVLDEMRIKTHPLSRFIKDAAALGVSFVFFEHHKEELPLWCNSIIYAENGRGRIIDTSDENKVLDYVYTPVPQLAAEQIALRLYPIYCEKINLEGSLVKKITLFDVLHIYNVDDLDLQKRWSESHIDHSMAAPLGVKIKNETVYLDIHEKAHGPHGLVAGTTGSGKSEILQSYILAMATLFHPYEVGFVIIDFKGGGMANQFKDLPHMLGSITNIDGAEINRSLSSIKAELLKRQNYFAEADVNHIDKYILKYKNHEVDTPLPHLVIIVDEFAELKAEYPDFMKELISTARIGRSLGVHLILSTQKPSGQVNEQIWSNSRFKLCLKVQTPEDSNEMIKSPLAAEIVEPGRAYLQVGNNEIFELFQSGFSGAPEKGATDTYAAKSYSIYSVNMAGKRQCIYEKKSVKEEHDERTQLEALVKYVNAYCKNKGIQKLDDICMPPLPEILEYPEVLHSVEGACIMVEIGLVDDPEHQSQEQAFLNVSTENTLIIGASQYGKTNFIQSIVRGLASKYSPNEVNIYILDFASMVLKNFESLNQVGGVVCSADDEKFKNLFKMLMVEIEIRKQKLVEAGVSSFVSYKEMGGRDLPQIVLIVDNYTAVKEMYLQDEDPLLYVCREGLSVGISVIICNQQTSGLGYRYMANLAKRVVFYCNESSEYSSVIERCRIAPANLPGRAVTEIQKNLYMMQTYLSFNGEREIERVQNMRQFVEKQNAIYAGMKARKIPEIPAILEEDVFVDEYKIRREDTYIVPIGLDYEQISVVNINLLELGFFGIIGREKSGKTNLLRVLFNQLYQNMFTAPTDVYLLDGMKRELREFKEFGFVKEYSIDSDDLIVYIEKAYEEATRRYEQVTKYEQDLTDEPLILIVVQNELAIQSLSKNATVMNKYKELMGRLKPMKICVIYVDVENAAISYSAPEILKDLKEKKNFFFFDDLKNMKLCDISMVTQRMFSKKITLGDAYWLYGNEICKIKTVKANEEGLLSN